MGAIFLEEVVEPVTPAICKEFIRHFFTRWGERPYPVALSAAAIKDMVETLGQKGLPDATELDLICSIFLLEDFFPQDEITPFFKGFPRLEVEEMLRTSLQIATWLHGLPDGPTSWRIFYWVQLRRLRWALCNGHPGLSLLNPLLPRINALANLAQKRTLLLLQILS